MRIKDALRPVVNRARRAKIAHRENVSSAVEDTATAETIERDVLLLSHSLERGMGIPDARPGFGKAKVRELIRLLGKLEDLGAPRDSFVLEEGVCVLRVWRDWQEAHGEGLSDTDIPATLAVLLEGEGETYKANAGASPLEKHEFGERERETVTSFIESRRSVRSFSEREVDEATLESVTRLALCAPSACNRQPCKVYFSKGGSAEIVSRGIRGNRGFESSIHQFAVVTCDRAMFSGAELYQWYVNGGIFLYSLTLSLHAYGIESCIFQWLAGDRGTETRNALGISDAEAIVGVAGFGYPAEGAKVLAAQRRDASQIMSFHE